MYDLITAPKPYYEIYEYRDKHSCITFKVRLNPTLPSQLRGSKHPPPHTLQLTNATKANHHPTLVVAADTQISRQGDLSRAS